MASARSGAARARKAMDRGRQRSLMPRFRRPLAQDPARLSLHEPGVADPVAPRVAPRALDRIRHALDPDRLAGGAREEERERAGPAVEVEYALVAPEASGLEGRG